MAKGRLFWRDILRIWLQWAGAALAAIPAGVVLGALLRHGVQPHKAEALAVSLGFALALAIWGYLGRLLPVQPVQYAVGFSPNVIQIPMRTAPAFAAVVLYISYCASTPMAPGRPPSMIQAHGTLNVASQS